MEYSDVSPGVNTRYLESQKNPDGLNLRIQIFVYVHEVHVYYIYGVRRMEILERLLFFF